jgi:predicted nucleic acid-binding protein
MVTNTKTTYIIDSSALMAHLLHEPYDNQIISEAISAFYQKSVKFIAPTILPFEVGNVLKSCVKSKRITALEAKKLYNHFLKLPIKYLPSDFKNIFINCMDTDLTYYDSSYLSLHKSTHYPLLTLDKKLTALIKV